MMSEILVKFGNLISSDFLINRVQVKVSDRIFEQIRVVAHDEQRLNSNLEVARGAEMMFSHEMASGESFGHVFS